MAHGVPVVAFAVPGILHWLEDGLTGRAVPPGRPRAFTATVLELLADEEQRQRLGRAARARWEESFHPDRHLEALLAHCQRLIRNHHAA